MSRSNAPWTSNQLLRLRKRYPIASWDDLEKEFAPHPKNSIENKAKQLRIRRHGRQRDWKAIAASHVPVFDLRVRS